MEISKVYYMYITFRACLSPWSRPYAYVLITVFVPALWHIRGWVHYHISGYHWLEITRQAQTSTFVGGGFLYYVHLLESGNVTAVGLRREVWVKSSRHCTHTVLRCSQGQNVSMSRTSSCWDAARFGAIFDHLVHKFTFGKKWEPRLQRLFGIEIWVYVILCNCKQSNVLE